MLILLLAICLLLSLYVAWMIASKIQITQYYRQLLNQRKLKKPAIRPKRDEPAHERLLLIEEYEQQLFDDAASLFIKEPHPSIQSTEAEQLEAELLKKMPAKTQAYIRQMDLGEWSIFWIFFEQSLECYVGQYGIFYTHVDRFGQEHRHTVLFETQPAQRLDNSID